jgi:hypothetical protein
MSHPFLIDIIIFYEHCGYVWMLSNIIYTSYIIDSKQYKLSAKDVNHRLIAFVVNLFGYNFQFCCLSYYHLLLYVTIAADNILSKHHPNMLLQVVASCSAMLTPHLPRLHHHCWLHHPHS